MDALISGLLEVGSPLPPPDMNECDEFLKLLEENDIVIESDLESEWWADDGRESDGDDEDDEV